MTSHVDEDEGDVFVLALPAVLVANKSDRLSDAPAQLRAFLDLSGLRYPTFTVSASTGEGMGSLGPWLFEHLHIVRVYTKLPGKPADHARPFCLRRGHTVGDVARLVHGDVARKLQYARLWGQSGFDGQHVGPEHVLADGDIVELH